MIVVVILIIFTSLLLYSMMIVSSNADKHAYDFGTKGENEMSISDEKKEYLRSYRRMYYKLKSLEEQKQGLVEAVRSAKAIQYSDMPKKTRQSDLSDYIIKIDELISQINECEIKLRNRRLAIEQGIITISDGIESEILRKRYIEAKSFEEIATELGYTYRHVIRMHGWALLKFELKCPTMS